jgi:hypothetical protein
MINLPSLENEADRLAALYVLEILDTVEEDEFDNIVRLACIIASVPVAAITFVDRDRIWYKSQLGLGIKQSPRDNKIS